MLRAEEFIKAYIQRGTELRRSLVDQLQSLDEEFCVPGFQPFDWQEKKNELGLEDIVDCMESRDAAVVTTKARRIWRVDRRFHLIRQGFDWAIERLEVACYRCRGRAERLFDKGNCPRCGGKTWVSLPSGPTDKKK